MKNLYRVAMVALVMTLGIVGCNRAQPTAECDCSIFPPAAGCDKTCGIATGIVESVNKDSVVIKVPVIQPAESPAGHPAESAAIQTRTFTVNASQAAQLGDIKPGSRVAVTYEQQQSGQMVKSIRAVPLSPPK